MIKKTYIIVASLSVLSVVAIVALGVNVVNVNRYDDEASESVFTTTSIDEPSSETYTAILETEPISDILTETTIQATSAINYTAQKKNRTNDDLFNLAAAVCREAGGESEEVQMLVANVIINRVNSSMYPNTIYGVLTDYKQYGMMWKYGVSFPKGVDQNTKDRCYKSAKRILDGERVCPDNVLFQAEFPQGSGIYKEINGIYFCYYG